MTGELISLFDQNTASAIEGRWRTTSPQVRRSRRRRAGRSRLATTAYHGLPGAIVAKIAPNTEADPVAILTQLLVCCGALIGRGAHFQVEATLHHPNQFLLVLIGDRVEQGPQGQLIRSRHQAADRSRSQLPVPARHRPLQWGRAGLDAARPATDRTPAPGQATARRSSPSSRPC